MYNRERSTCTSARILLIRCHYRDKECVQVLLAPAAATVLLLPYERRHDEASDTGY